MIRAKIKAPKNIITGAFSIGFHFSHKVNLTLDDIRIETLAGQPIGSVKDVFSGGEYDYTLQCYFDYPLSGKSRISIQKADVDCEPFEISYDIDDLVGVEFGTQLRRRGKVIIPVQLSSDALLEKSHIEFSEAVPYRLFGSGRDYSIRIENRRRKVFEVRIGGEILKHSGITASITPAVMKVDLS